MFEKYIEQQSSPRSQASQSSQQLQRTRNPRVQEYHLPRRCDPSQLFKPSPFLCPLLPSSLHLCKLAPTLKISTSQLLDGGGIGEIGREDGREDGRGKTWKQEGYDAENISCMFTFEWSQTDQDNCLGMISGWHRLWMYSGNRFGTPGGERWPFRPLVKSWRFLMRYINRVSRPEQRRRWTRELKCRDYGGIIGTFVI